MEEDTYSITTLTKLSDNFKQCTRMKLFLKCKFIGTRIFDDKFHEFYVRLHLSSNLLFRAVTTQRKAKGNFKVL